MRVFFWKVKAKAKAKAKREGEDEGEDEDGICMYSMYKYTIDIYVYVYECVRTGMRGSERASKRDSFRGCELFFFGLSFIFGR